MSWVLALFVVAGFALVFERLKLPEHAREAASRAHQSMRTLRDPELDDDGKEEALRDHAIQLFRLLGILLGGSILAIGLPLFPVWLLDLTGAASMDAVLAVLERPDFLAGVSVAGCLAYLTVRRARRRGVTPS